LQARLSHHSQPNHAQQSLSNPKPHLHALHDVRCAADGHTTIPLCRDIRAYLEQEFLHKQAKSAEAEGEAEEDGNGGSRPQQQQQQQSGEQQASLPQQWSQDHQGQQLKVTDKVSRGLGVSSASCLAERWTWAVHSCQAHAQLVWR
jgi:hypothetical protein